MKAYRMVFCNFHAINRVEAALATNKRLFNAAYLHFLKKVKKI